MQTEEKEYVGNRDCDKCQKTSQVDITQWKEVEHWICPLCKNKMEGKLY